MATVRRIKCVRCAAGYRTFLEPGCEMLYVHLVAWHPVDALRVQSLQLYELYTLLHEQGHGLLRALHEVLPIGYGSSLLGRSFAPRLSRLLFILALLCKRTNCRYCDLLHAICTNHLPPPLHTTITRPSISPLDTTLHHHHLPPPLYTTRTASNIRARGHCTQNCF